MLVNLLHKEAKLTAINIRLVSELKLKRIQRRKYRNLQRKMFTYWKPKASQKANALADSTEKYSETFLDELWPRLETKLKERITKNLASIIKDAVKAEALKAVDEYISLSEFKNSLPESLSFVSGEVKDSIKGAKDKITSLEAVKLELQYKIDDLEQYTRRTNIRI